MPTVGQPLAPEIRQEFERDLIAAYARSGPAFAALPVVREFRSRHAIAASTLYRWVDAMRASGVLGQQMGGGPSENFADTLSTDNLSGQDEITDDTDGEEIPPAQQPLARLAPDIPPPSSGIAVVANLEQCIAGALQIMRHARKAPRDLEQARVLIAASEHLRRCLETAIRLREQIVTYEKIEAFHRAVVSTLREDCPLAADRALEKLERLCRDWSQSGNPSPT